MHGKKKLLITIILIVIILGSLTAFFYPKKRVVGEISGLICHGETSYREEFSCFGIKHDFCPSWSDYGCDFLCYGEYMIKNALMRFMCQKPEPKKQKQLVNRSLPASYCRSVSLRDFFLQKKHITPIKCNSEVVLHHHQPLKTNIQ